MKEADARAGYRAAVQSGRLDLVVLVILFRNSSVISNNTDGAPAPPPVVLVKVLVSMGVEGRGLCCVGLYCCALVIACKASMSPYPLRES